MNSPIQGTAADIIKIAMNRVYKRLKSEGKKSRLVLQVHDELLIETRKEELTQVARILEEEMKGAPTPPVIPIILIYFASYQLLPSCISTSSSTDRFAAPFISSSRI